MVLGLLTGFDIPQVTGAFLKGQQGTEVEGVIFQSFGKAGYRMTCESVN